MIHIDTIMYGFTTSQKIEIVVIVASLIMYFCGLTFAQQNAWSYIFSIALLMLVVGTIAAIQT